MKLARYFQKYSFLIGLVLFAFILLKSNPQKLWTNISRADFRFLFLALLLILPMFFFKTLCWNYLKRKQGIVYGLKDSFLMYNAGQYLGLLTPGRLGEIAKSWYLKKDGHSLGRSLVSTVLDRLSDLFFLLGFTALGSLFFWGQIKQQFIWPVFVFIVLLIIFLLALKIGFVRWGIKKFFYWLVPEKNKSAFKLNFRDFWRDLKNYRPANWLVIFFITALSWFFYYLQMYFLAKAVGLSAPFIYLAVCVTLAGLVTLLPISISGIGTRDAALILLLAPLGIARETVVVFSALILLAFVASALLGLICWWLKPLRL